MSRAPWFPTHEQFRAGLARAKKNSRCGAIIYADLAATKLTFRDAIGNTWLAEVNAL
jgi:hypothetical protein